jgi:hypothetical protein
MIADYLPCDVEMQSTWNVLKWTSIVKYNGNTVCLIVSELFSTECQAISNSNCLS